MSDDRRGALRLEIERVERSIFDQVYALLREWLTSVTQRVLRGGDLPPEPDALWSRVPAWGDVLDALMSGSIGDAVRLGIERVLGATYAWDSQGAVDRYLGEARNRLVRIPDEVHRMITAEISAGVDAGEGVAQLAARVDALLTDAQQWRNRAETIARTEAIGALNAGRMLGYAQVVADDPGADWQVEWLATDDARTRPTHVEADGQRVPWGAPFIVGGAPLSYPGDPGGPAQEVINCRCVPLLVEGDEIVDRGNRQMRG